MSDGDMDRSKTSKSEAVLRDGLVKSDFALNSVTPILTHMIAQSEARMVSEVTVAQVQGMLDSICRQLVEAAPDAVSDADHADSAQILDDLTERLAMEQQLLRLCFARAVEGQLTERMERTHSLDPILSPLFQELIAADSPETAELAMAALAAQSRFVQHSKRMALPFHELPAELFDQILNVWREFCSQQELDLTLQSLEVLREDYDESATRISLLARLLAMIGGASRASLIVPHAGVALFAAGLGQLSDQSRDLALMATLPGQLARLTLTLRASGLNAEEITAALAFLDPDAVLPLGIAEMLPDQAQSILRYSDAGNDR